MNNMCCFQQSNEWCNERGSYGEQEFGMVSQEMGIWDESI